MTDLIYLSVDGSACMRVAAGSEGDVTHAPIRDGVVVGRSGAIQDEEPARAAMRTWGGEGRSRIDATIAGRLAEAAEIEVVIVPRAGDVVSDLPSAMSLARRWASGEAAGRVRLLIDPELLMTEEMRRHESDHTERCLLAAEMLGPTMVAAVCCGEALSRRAAEAGLRVVRRG